MSDVLLNCGYSFKWLADIATEMMKNFVKTIHFEVKKNNDVSQRNGLNATILNHTEFYKIQIDFTFDLNIAWSCMFLITAPFWKSIEVDNILNLTLVRTFFIHIRAQKYSMICYDQLIRFYPN